MEQAWQDVLDMFHYGIYLVTLQADGMINGMIASWVTQCSHEPPLVLVAIRRNRLSHGQIRTSGALCINLLPQQARDLPPRFKISDWRRKFDGIEHTCTPGGLPVIKAVLGYLECAVERIVDTGDHSLFIARITGGQRLQPGHCLTSDEYEGVYRGDR